MGSRKRTGIAAWPAEHEAWEAGETVMFHGHVTADQCRAWWVDADNDELTTSDDVTHRYARKMPARDQDTSTAVLWPYPPGPGAYPVTLATLVEVPRG